MGDTREPIASVVVPAHNEELSIHRLLESLTSDPDVTLEIVVVCNGCTDSTADVARRHRAAVTVIEIPTPSKPAALLRGDAVATTFPRVYVDADIEISARSVSRLAAAVGDGATLAAGPARRIPRTGVSWPVRWYYDVWEQLPTVRDGLFGRGVIAFSRTGHERIRGLPTMLSDDLVVSEAFTVAERRVIPDAQAVVRPPHTLPDLLRRRVRVATGVSQADGAGLRSASAATTPATLARLTLARPQHVPKVAVFLAVTVVARARARRAVRRGDFHTWLRDESSRRPAGTS